MLPVLGLYALPVAFLMAITGLYLTERRKGIRVGLVCFALSILAGVWAITRSSTPSLQIVLLPFQATAAGLLGLGFGFGWRATSTLARVAGRLCLLIVALLIANQLVQGKSP